MKNQFIHPVMKISSIIFLLTFSSLLLAKSQLPDFTGIVESAKDSVVNISTTTNGTSKKRFRNLEIPEFPEGSPFGELFKKFFDHEGIDPGRRKSASLGSGFIISDDGFILTNHHVIDGADEVIVRMSNRDEYVAEVIGSDKASDIAVLKVDAENLKVLKFGDSNALKVGEWVLAIGSPFGFDHTVTAGIVSAKGRSLPSDNYVPFIQTDVAINPGNSGGPLFNLDGEVIGINSQIYSRTGGFMGLSFAIPIEMAVDVANQIKNTGSVSRGWLGVLIQEVTRELAESFGMSNPHGALIARVLPNSPAEAADLQVGDVIVEFNGKKVSRSSSLPPLVGRTEVGKFASVTVIRNKRRQVIEVKIEQLPETTQQASLSPVEPEKSPAILGMKVEPLSKEVREKLHVESGVLIAEVEHQGAAQDAGIKAGDVITMLNNQSIATVEDFEQAVDSLEEGKSVAILLQRSAGPVFLALKP